jgi:hypothetical protein
MPLVEPVTIAALPASGRAGVASWAASRVAVRSMAVFLVGSHEQDALPWNGPEMPAAHDVDR